MANASIKVITDFFKKQGVTLKDWQTEWKDLPEEDKEDLRMGLGDGSLTYPDRKKPQS